jgi:hypothetical protein
MKKQAVLASLAVLAALAVAVTVPAAFGDSSNGVPPANGNDYVLPDGSVYQQNDDGTFSWVPNVATGNAMGLDWNNLTPVSQLDGSISDPIPSVQSLSNASFNRTGGTTANSVVKVTPANGWDYYLPNGQVWQDNLDGTCSWIPDVATGNAMHVDWNNLVEVDTLPCDPGMPFPHVD